MTFSYFNAFFILVKISNLGRIPRLRSCFLELRRLRHAEVMKYLVNTNLDKSLTCRLDIGS